MEKTHLHVHHLTRQVDCLSVDHAAVSLHSQAVIDASAKGWKKSTMFLKGKALRAFAHKDLHMGL